MSFVPVVRVEARQRIARRSAPNCARRALELDDNQVERRAHRQLLALEEVAVELHQHRPRAEGAALVHPPARRRRRDLAVVREVHLAAHGHLQVVHAVERARGEDADGGRRREPLPQRQVGAVVVDHEAVDVVPHHDLVRRARDVREVVAARRRLEQRLGLHRELDRPRHHAVVVDRLDDQLVRVRAHARVQPLVGAGDEARARHDVLVEAAVIAGPVGVLAHQADAAGHEELEVGHRGASERVRRAQRAARAFRGLCGRAESADSAVVSEARAEAWH